MTNIFSHTIHKPQKKVNSLAAFIFQKKCFSFICSVDFADFHSDAPSKKVTSPKDEFAQFVTASIHPPNELSVPRCYSDQICLSPRRSPGSTPHSPYSRSVSMDPGQHYKSNSSLSPKVGSRPKLKRETAHDIEDGDFILGIEQIEINDIRYNKNTLSPHLLLKPEQRPLVHQKSAPGTPLSPKHMCPSRTPSDESSSGFLNVPQPRVRGSSLCGELDMSGNNLYLLRQFNIQGKKVIHLGDSFQQRTNSSTSINSLLSRFGFHFDLNHNVSI